MKLFTTPLLFIIAIFAALPMQSQTANDYMDLLVLYVDGDYEKCLKKAEKYMDKDETKRDPLPYLYTSMTYYEISRDHKYVEDYPKAYRECLKYLTKYRRKDKEYLFEKDAKDFIEKIKFEVAEQIENYELGGTEKDYRKSKSLLKKLKRIDPDDVGVQLMLGVHYVYANDKSSGKDEIKEALAKLDEEDDEFEFELDFSEMTPSQQYYFKEGLIAYYNYRAKNYPNEAEEILMLGKPYYKADNEDLEIDNYQDYVKLIKEVNG
ncbi:hypothetical protein [Parvicella tangerina]|uniref:Tetratricopeptide repeat protein n=1 Tax=Parvicella tangerina TaxID=2829795 RepID=A0A916JN13_9FLAO|nr:hypothetical protein [Parvicella tangerina]CAG5082884.1 hypothetical protein CRYO30217_02034 [Parvicella tangerina]